MIQANRFDRQPDWPRLRSLPVKVDPTRTSLIVVRKLDQRMYEIYQQGCNVVQILRDKSSSGIPDNSLRYAVQHDLLSFPKMTDLCTFTSSELLVCLCRTAGLIFSDMVLYPTPYSTGVKPRLAQQLDEIMRGPEIRNLPDLDTYEHLLVWACVLGAIASTFLPAYRQSFLDRLRSLLSGQDSVEDLTEILEGFMWYAPVCDPPMLLVWKDLAIPSNMNIWGE